MKRTRIALAFAFLLAPLAMLHGQGTAADYQRAQGLRGQFQNLAVDIPGPANWIGQTDHFWYHKTVKGGTQFVLVDAATGTKRAAFDHVRLAAALSAVAGQPFTALNLPFIDPPAAGARGGGGGRGANGSGGLSFTNDEHGLAFALAGFAYTCNLDTYTCAKGAELAPGTGGFGRGGRGGLSPAGDVTPASAYSPYDPSTTPDMVDNNVQDGIENLVAENTGQDGPQGVPPQAGASGRGGANVAPQMRTSPDGQWDAVIENYNVFLQKHGARPGSATPLSLDGSEGDYYSLRSVAWSPDSKHLAAYKTRPGYAREIHYVESSPADQIQPKSSVGPLYNKAGDTLDLAQPALFEIATKKETVIDNALFPNPFDLSPPVWWKDSRGFTFEYNQRGHQVYRVIEVNGETGAARTLVNETSPTFIDYRPLVDTLTDTGKKVRFNLNDGKEIIWASERDGWEHLYLYDGVTGQVKNQITKGHWVVRAVDFVDEANRQIWFEAAGMTPGQDPYFTNYYRINFDGTGLVQYTTANGNHSVRFSPDRQYYVDTWSRVDLAPISELRRTADQSLVAPLEKGDISALVAAGWKMPEVFVARGRDGLTDIWGVIFKPTNFDPAKKYPVVENIYAGPQGSFVPKSFSVSTQALPELGFIVVQIDGMGTNNRSRAFHDVAWKDLADAGFPDRILWHKAVAAKYSWYDIGRVGIYGTSAGGQNSLGALLFHPDFYKVGVSNSGCHDNRMDKIWWNEQWMGWPVGPQYAASSNVDNAYRLQGDLLLVYGELDNNVDPASTPQVVNQLIQHNKKFDLLMVPGGGHGAGGQYYQHLLQDFFVRHLQHLEPPGWNQMAASR